MPTIKDILTQAVQLHQSGRLADAEALYRRILQQEPGHADALHLLGLLAHQAGQHAEAYDLIRQALAVDGSQSLFHCNLAAVCLPLGRLEEAVAESREAIRLSPALAEAHNNLGAALQRLGRLDEAAAALQEALRLDPRHVEARCTLSAVYNRQGRLPEAQACLQQVVQMVPTHAAALNGLGCVLLGLGRPGQALRPLREAVRLQPAFAEAHSNLGLALRELDRVDEALPSFREALRLQPRYAGGHNNLGYTLETLGKVDEAAAEFRETLHLEPDNAFALASLAGLATAGHVALSEQELHHMKQLADRESLVLEDRCRLHFALARWFDKAGSYDEAFEHCRRGNTMRKELNRRRGVVFDPEAHRRLVDRLIAVYSPEFFRRTRSFGLDKELPVFIVGMPRSGTTLAEQILASHPLVHGAGELRAVDTTIHALQRALGKPPGSYPEPLDRLDAPTARALAEDHLKRLTQRSGSAVRVIDKQPFNFLHLGLIATLFPKARIIHCQRDALDTCLSCYFQGLGGPQAFTPDLQHLGQYVREYERLMDHWRRVLPVPLFELRYEELTTDQEAVTRHMVEFCGLAWDDRCLRFHETQRAILTPSTLQVRQPMYRGSVGRWKRYEKHLGPLRDALAGKPA